MTVALRKADSSRDARDATRRLRDGDTAGGQKADPLRLSALAERARGLAECSPYTDRPPSLEQVVGYVRAGGFVPGDQPWWVEAPGYAYGALVAVPATAVGYAFMWVVQRPSRLALVLYVLALVWAAWFAPSLMPVLLVAPLLPLGLYSLAGPALKWATKSNSASVSLARGGK